MHNIPENFSGYLTIEDSVFVYHASKTKVTMFPASKDSREQFKIIAELGQKKIVGPQFIYGTYQGCLIAFLMRSNIKLNLFGLDPSCYFITPLIMKSEGNSENFYSQLSEDWTKFHAITFYSGNINFLYSPDEMIDKFKLLSFENAVNAIPIKDINTYSHIIKCNLSGEEIEIIISIGHNELPKNKEKNLSGFSVGNLNSFIRLSFNSSKDFNEADNYIKLIKKLVSFLTKQNNVFFNICLEQKNTNGKLLKTVDCKIFDTYPNYSINEQPSVISLIQLKKYLPVLITKLYNNNYSALFDVLPIDNAKKYVVSISDIQNICSTLEIMYELKKIKRNKDESIEKLKKNIKDIIQKFNNENPSIDIYKQTTISSAFTYLDYTLKNKIITLYEEHKKILDKFCEDKKLVNITPEKIDAFVKLRNQKTHTGTVNLDDSVFLYLPLVMLVYICVLEDIGVPEEEIFSIIYPSFIYH